MAVETHIYDSKFFKDTIKLEADSAAEFVRIVLEYYSPANLVDVGCGAGIYLNGFAQNGINEALGIDGSPAAKEEFLLGRDKLVIFDLSEKYKFNRRYDLCLCLEVAEHLETGSADTLVETLISASDNIIFSAAVPGQGPRSIGHINEQPHEYWIRKFENHGYAYLKVRTEEMRQKMASGKVVWWIVNNLMIFTKN